MGDGFKVRATFISEETQMTKGPTCLVAAFKQWDQGKNGFGTCGEKDQMVFGTDLDPAKQIFKLPGSGSWNERPIVRRFYRSGDATTKLANCPALIQIEFFCWRSGGRIAEASPVQWHAPMS